MVGVGGVWMCIGSLWGGCVSGVYGVDVYRECMVYGECVVCIDNTHHHM